MNIGVHVPFSIRVLSRYISRSRIARLYGSSIFNFLRSLYTFFHSGCTNSHSHQELQEGSLFSTPYPAFVVCRVINDGHSGQCEVISHLVLICISLIISDVAHLFICLLPIYMSSLEKCLFRSSSHLSIVFVVVTVEL